MVPGRQPVTGDSPTGALDHADAADQAWLKTFLQRCAGSAGTVHRVKDRDLLLVAARNIPPPLLERVAYVPWGKGMAGQAQVERKPVQTCNIQTGTSPHINPMAKLVGGTTAIALPVFDPSGEVRAVVGISFVDERQVDTALEADLMEGASTLP